jgi:hypothetical protein
MDKSDSRSDSEKIAYQNIIARNDERAQYLFESQYVRKEPISEDVLYDCISLLMFLYWEHRRNITIGNINTQYENTSNTEYERVPAWTEAKMVSIAKTEAHKAHSNMEGRYLTQKDLKDIFYQAFAIIFVIMTLFMMVIIGVVGWMTSGTHVTDILPYLYSNNSLLKH